MSENGNANSPENKSTDTSTNLPAGEFNQIDLSSLFSEKPSDTPIKSPESPKVAVSNPHVAPDVHTLFSKAEAK